MKTYRCRTLMMSSRRLRIEVIVARNDAVMSETTGAGSVGDAASLEVSGSAGRAVWDIRAGMIEGRAKLEYLQGYIRSSAEP